MDIKILYIARNKAGDTSSVPKNVIIELGWRDDRFVRHIFIGLGSGHRIGRACSAKKFAAPVKVPQVHF